MLLFWGKQENFGRGSNNYYHIYLIFYSPAFRLHISRLDSIDWRLSASMTPYIIPTEPPIMFDHPHSPSVQGKLTTILSLLSVMGSVSQTWLTQWLAFLLMMILREESWLVTPIRVSEGYYTKILGFHFFLNFQFNTNNFVLVLVRCHFKKINTMKASFGPQNTSKMQQNWMYQRQETWTLLYL